MLRGIHLRLNSLNRLPQVYIRKYKQTSSHTSRTSSHTSPDLRYAMRSIPQPVVVITSCMDHPMHGRVRRGVTCSSFTSISLQPSTVSISLFSGNLINKIIEESGYFAANILSERQLKAAMHFAGSLNADLTHNQFEDIPSCEGMKGLPVLAGSKHCLQCHVTKVDVIADHHVWYGEVLELSSPADSSCHPMLYYQRTFRSIGDQIFMQAFEDTSMPFEEWTHEAHLRMAWNYLTEYSSEEASQYIKDGIKRFNEKNRHRIQHGYSETVTAFYTHVISKAIKSMPSEHSFEDFLLRHSYLKDPNFLYRFYSNSVLENPLSKTEFLYPDVASLP